MKFTRAVFPMLLIVLASCNNSPSEIPPFNQSFSSYISSFTSGVISKKAVIQIQLNKEVKPKIQNANQLSKGLIGFEPKIEGNFSLVNNHTLEFYPSEDLEPGAIYRAKLELGELIEVPDSLSEFEFGFQVLKTQYEWSSIRLLATPQSQMEWYQLEGSVNSADEEELSVLERLITAELDGRKMNVRWQLGEMPRTYKFTVDSIKRSHKAQQINLLVNADLAGAESLKNKVLELASLEEFNYIDYSLVKYPSSYIQLNFSDPIKAPQDLTGLITLEGEENLRFQIENTSIQIFPEGEVYGTRKLMIFPGIENILGYKFKEQKEISLEFLNERPQVQLIGEGNIIPLGGDLHLPFKAISLNAVDIKVVKIPEGNVLQFLQTNSYGGEDELYRVGKVVANKKIDLHGEGSLRDWNNYSADLSEIIRPEAGALYRVYISFQKSYSLYACPETESEFEEEGDYWYYEDYYYYNRGDEHAYNRSDYYYQYPPGYRWSERENPCHVSYFNANQFVTRNILATNIGLIVKKTEAGRLDFTVTDMLNNQPIAGAKVSLYDYQSVKLGEATSDENGWSSLPDKGKPYFVMAAKDKQRIYLKLQDGEALSLSNFQVSGSSVASGLKGYIYGERGVWRPGDSIFLNFILQDEKERLPQGHPLNFSLSDPQGRVIYQEVKALANNQDIYSFPCRTAPSAITGNYMARVRVGNRVFEERIRVETVKPNRLNIDLDFDDEVLGSGKAKAKLSVNWLTGIAAAEAKTDIEATIKSVGQGFEKWPNFIFTDAVRDFSTTQQTVYEGEVGPNGTREILVDLGDYNQAPGLLKARFVAKAFEGGGAFSTEYFDKTLSPYENYVGMALPQPKDGRFLETDHEYPLHLRTVDALGKPVSIKNMEVKVYKLDFHWWYNSENENLARFVNNASTHLVSSGEVSSINGQATYKLKVEYPQWGRFLVRVCDGEGGHCTSAITYFDWPNSRKGQRPKVAGATLLNFNAEKEKYQIGETIRATIPAAQGSRVLITLEDGSGIQEKKWLVSQGGEVVFETEAKASMAPNVYISASLLQAHAQTENDRPIRMYGVVPVEVFDPATMLKPLIKAKDVWRPESTVNIEVSEENGREMSYTLAVVDEGLLSLTAFKTPEPWNYFYAKEALGINTYDMYNSVLGAFGGKLQQILAIGGDEALANAENSNLNRFKPMVKHLGPYKLRPNGSATHEVKIPNYIGAARVMVVAANKKRAYGSSEKSVKVRKPLMVLSTLPRILSPGDEVVLPVTVFAMEENVKKVKLRLKATGDVTIVGPDQHQLSFNQVGERVVNFKLKVPEVWGQATLKVEASSGSEKAYDETELKVRLPNPPRSVVHNLMLQPGADTALTYIPPGIEGTNSFAIEASSIPPINLEHRLKYLTRYPYGCTEQTVSAAFPQLFLSKLMDLDENFKRSQEINVRAALDKVYQRQQTNGQIAYWPGQYNGYYNDYATSYAGHFMIEAEAQGFQVANGVLARWKKHQQTKARNWRPQNSGTHLTNDLDQAYRLYTLALIQSAEVGAMNRMREIKDLNETSLWYLAGCYAMIGQKTEAEKLIARIRNLVPNDGRYYYFGSKLRNKSIELLVLHQLSKKAEAMKVGREVAKMLSKNAWYNTHSLSMGLLSVTKTFGENAKNKNGIKWAYQAGSRNYEGVSKGSFQSFQVRGELNEAHEYKLYNRSNMPLHFSTTYTGTPVDFEVPAEGKNLFLSVRYLSTSGNEIDVSRIKQGQDFVAEVRIQKTGNVEGYQSMALNQMFPTGWEIINTRMLDSEKVNYDYRDIRDDRVYTFFDLRYTKSVTFQVQLNATYAGRYFLPPVEAEDMYNNEIYARTAGRWVEVVR